MKTITEYKCERCGHKWLPRTKERPRVCPKCKSPYWDRPRTPKATKKRSTKKDKIGNIKLQRFIK